LRTNKKLSTQEKAKGKKMKRVLVTVFMMGLGIAGAEPVLAQTAPPPAAAPALPAVSPSHLALAREVVVSSGMASSFERTIPLLIDQMKNQLVSRPELTKDLNEVLDAMKPEMELQRQDIITISARIYASKLSESQLKEVSTFFASAVGKSWVSTQPEALTQIFQESQAWSQRVAEYLMIRVRAEMVKRGHQL
jgi:uncharacterized protein